MHVRRHTLRCGPEDASSAFFYLVTSSSPVAVVPQAYWSCLHGNRLQRVPHRGDTREPRDSMSFSVAASVSHVAGNVVPWGSLASGQHHVNDPHEFISFAAIGSSIATYCMPTNTFRSMLLMNAWSPPTPQRPWRLVLLHQLERRRQFHPLQSMRPLSMRNGARHHLFFAQVWLQVASHYTPMC